MPVRRPSGSTANAKPWTTTEINKAAQLWADRYTYDQIAEALGRSRGAVKHIIARDRDKFPRYNRPQGGSGVQQRQLALKIMVSPFLHKTIKKRAKDQRHSMSYLIQEALREYFLRKDQRVGPAPPRDRNLPAQPRQWDPPAGIPAAPFMLALTPAQYNLYRILSANIGKFVHIDLIIHAFWGHDPNGGPSNPRNIIAIAATELRKRLGLTKAQLYSRAELGYILAVEPKLPNLEKPNDNEHDSKRVCIPSGDDE